MYLWGIVFCSLLRARADSRLRARFARDEIINSLRSELGNCCGLHTRNMRKSKYAANGIRETYIWRWYINDCTGHPLIGYFKVTWYLTIEKFSPRKFLSGQYCKIYDVRGEIRCFQHESWPLVDIYFTYLYKDFFLRNKSKLFPSGKSLSVCHLLTDIWLTHAVKDALPSWEVRLKNISKSLVMTLLSCSFTKRL